MSRWKGKKIVKYLRPILILNLEQGKLIVFYTLPKVALYVLFFIMIMKGMKKSTIQLIESKSLNIIFQLKGLKPKNKGHTNFYECCDMTEKVYLPQVAYMDDLLLWKASELPPL